jgi:hypothetical protein
MVEHLCEILRNPSTDKKKKELHARHNVILATWEAEAGGLQV